MAMRQARKGSFAFDADEYPKLSRSDFDKVKDLFRRYDYNGAGNIKKPELLDILKDMGISMSENLKKKVGDDLERQGIRSIDLGIALQMVNQVREWEEDDDDFNDDYVNAFVAMGGNPDRSGIVRKDTIYNLIKDFELTFDIEDFFEKGSLHADDLDFQAFCTLFEGDPNDEKSMSRANSLISLMSERGSKKKDKSGDAFSVKYRDFEKFMLKEKEKGKWFLV